MPVMNGPDAAREMRKIGFLGPIIGVTGDVNTEEFLASGADMVSTLRYRSVEEVTHTLPPLLPLSLVTTRHHMI